MSNEIQQARDVLAKWRTHESDLALRWPLDAHYGYGDHMARLIIGTAGNPELLDAIDALLREWAVAGPHLATGHPMLRIAAAILAADERMRA